MRRYMDWMFEDTAYIEGLRDELIKWEQELASRVYDGNWPRVIRDIVSLLRQDILDHVSELRVNLAKAEEHRRMLDDAYCRQVAENQGNDGAAGGEPGDPDKVSSRVEQQGVGATHEEDDNYSGKDIPGEEFSGESDRL